jgi:hypothetical protein
MSALPAQAAELSPRHAASAVPGRPQVVQAQRRAERRAEQKLARRDRQRWSIYSCAVLGGAFVLTVGILDMLH